MLTNALLLVIIVFLWLIYGGLKGVVQALSIIYEHFQEHVIPILESRKSAKQDDETTSLFRD